MAAMAPPSDYSEDAARIDRDYVPSGATTEAEIQAALSDAGFPEAAQSHIQDWLVSEEDAWGVVGPEVQDAGSVRRAIDRESGGTISEGRASEISDSIGSQINSARARAAQRVTDDGQVRTEGGQFLGKIQNVEEVVREDGIYFRHEETGSEARAASFNR